jgi:tripartite ATP-independent transporter DctM subunit
VNPTALLDRSLRGAVVAALALATLLPLSEALGRQWRGFSIPGSSLYVQHLVMWLAFVGGLITTRAGKHLTLSTSEFMGEGALRRNARLVTAALSAAVLGILTYASWKLVSVNRDMGEQLPIGLPGWVSELVMPVCLGVMALIFVWRAADDWKRRLVALAAIPAAFALGLVPDTVADFFWPLALVLVAAAPFGAPIFVVLGGLALLLFFADQTPVAAVSAEIYRLIQSPTLPAIPLLTAAGYVLAEGGASQRLLRFFRGLFGWMPGGLALVVAGACALFTTFTGGSGITIIALGGLVYPMLRADRYPESFSLGLITAGGSLGLLFPPSLPVILYAVVATSSEMTVPADQLYLAGLLPGLLLVGLVAGYGILTGRRTATDRQAFELREALAGAWGAKWELGLPVFVIALFATGYASMVETAAAAVAYAVVTQCFVTRDIGLRKDLPRVLFEASALMGAILILLAVAMGLTSWIVDAQVAYTLLDWVKAHVESKLVFLLALNVLLLVVGCLVDIYAAIVIVVPLIAPIGAAFGVHPLHLGVIFLANLELGFLTPPVGMNLFLSSTRFERPLMQVYRDTFPFLMILLVGVLLITYVPDLSLGLLKLLGRLEPVDPLGF